MRFSYTFIRNLGLVILLAVIFLEGMYSYYVMSRNSLLLREIITHHEVVLQRWDEIREIIDEARDRLNDYRLGRLEVIATVDLLVKRVMNDVSGIRGADEDESVLLGVEEILKTAGIFKESVLAYGAEVRKKGRDTESARRLGDHAMAVSDRMVSLVRDGASYVRERIRQEHLSILTFSSISQNMLGLVLLMAALLTGGVSVWLARSLAAPIHKLVAGTKKLAAGDLSCRVEIDSKDEIGELALSFNTMAEKLATSRNELLVAKTFNENIINSMINTLVVIDRSSAIQVVNKATCDLLDYNEEDLVGQPVSVIFADGCFEELGLARLAEKGLADNKETTYKGKDGAMLRMLLSWAVIRDDHGEFRGFVFVAQDISIQAEALRAGHLASLGELAAGVAHEINNPINSIINFAQLLIDEIREGEPVSQEILIRIIREGDRISGIVRSLLSFAREDDKRKEFVCLEEILEETLILTETQIRKDGIQLAKDFPPALPAIAGHFQQIQQVFLNIINNARYALNRKFEYAHPDKILSISGRIVVKENAEWVETAFLDSGIGIPSGIIDKVKNPFFSTKPAGLGTGLGLTISHGIVTDHGGRVEIESREGEYTKVVIRFPVSAGDVGNLSHSRPAQPFKLF